MIRRAVVFIREHPHPAQLWGVVLVSVAVLAGFAWVIGGNRTNARLGKQAHDALCVVRVKVVRDIRKSRAFLRDNPKGIPGIPRKLIRDSITDDTETLRGLNLLDCVPPPEPT